MTGPAAKKPLPLVLSAQELVQLPSDWMAVERLRVRRRIVSETISVPVVVRREELVVDRFPLPGTAVKAADEPLTPLVWLLHEEVPVISVDIRPYEQVTISVVEVDGEQAITASLDSEHVEVLVKDATDRGAQ
jgi:stress response protein YsnF